MPDQTAQISERATEYEVCAAQLPEDDLNRSHFALTVAYKGRDRWAVLHRSSWAWNEAEGCWDFEPMPSERDDDYLATHRYPLDEALAIARRLAPDITLGQVRAADAAREYAAT